jgi:hypothetical protein
MPQFTRPTINAAGRTIDAWSQSSLDSFLLEHDLDRWPPAGKSVVTRANLLIRYLLDSPDATTGDGENLIDTVVRDLVKRAIPVRSDLDFAEQFRKLARALAVDGFVVTDGELRRAMPVALGVAAADDEVHQLLKRFGFDTPMGHLDQAIKSHGNGLWAAANSQLRSFVEGLIDEIAEKLAQQGPPEKLAQQGPPLPSPGGARLTWLAKLNPPFVLPGSNEWDGQGKGFLEAFFRRLHPQGSHPGLSDDDDSTFRLHTALVVARLLLRRLAARLP